MCLSSNRFNRKLYYWKKNACSFYKGEVLSVCGEEESCFLGGWKLWPFTPKANTNIKTQNAN